MQKNQNDISTNLSSVKEHIDTSISSNKVIHVNKDDDIQSLMNKNVKETTFVVYNDIALADTLTFKEGQQLYATGFTKKRSSTVREEPVLNIYPNKDIKGHLIKLKNNNTLAGFNLHAKSLTGDAKISDYVILLDGAISGVEINNNTINIQGKQSSAISFNIKKKDSGKISRDTYFNRSNLIENNSLEVGGQGSYVLYFSSPVSYSTIRNNTFTNPGDSIESVLYFNDILFTTMITNNLIGSYENSTNNQSIKKVIFACEMEGTVIAHNFISTTDGVIIFVKNDMSQSAIIGNSIICDGISDIVSIGSSDSSNFTAGNSLYADSGEFSTQDIIYVRGKK